MRTETKEFVTREVRRTLHIEVNTVDGGCYVDEITDSFYEGYQRIETSNNIDCFSRGWYEKVDGFTIRWDNIVSSKITTIKEEDVVITYEVETTFEKKFLRVDYPVSFKTTITKIEEVKND